MSRGPKFADHTKPRGLYATPSFKYYLATTISITGFWFVAAYFMHSMLRGEKLEWLRPKYKFIERSSGLAESIVLDELIALRRLRREEIKTKNK